ncbi:MAG: carboxypeptidase-like regulatory domain-containing protein [Acidimicrobiia bacterium]
MTDGATGSAQRRLAEWARRAVGDGTTVRIGPAVPDGSPGGPIVVLQPLGLAPEQEVRCTATRAPFRFRVRYLVTTDGSVEEGPELFDLLLAAAVADGTMTVSVDPLAPEWWLALGARPRPAFVVDVGASIEQATEIAPRVRAPMAVQAVALRPLTGRLVGPGDVPMAGARVEVATTRAVTRTGPTGAFRFAAVPDTEGPTQLRIDARGLHLVADVDVGPDDDVVIRCQPGEA